MGPRLDALRDVDRRVGQRAWTKVRRPRLPVWVWLLVDLHIGGLFVAAATGLAGLVSDGLAQMLGLIGFGMVVAVAVANLVRTTRP